MTDIRSLIPDGMAMDQIHGILTGKRWTSDTIEAVAEVVERTGRLIESPDEPLMFCKNCGTPIVFEVGIGWCHDAEAPESSPCYVGNSGPEPGGPWFCAVCNGQIAGGPVIGWKHLGPAEQGHGATADADHQAAPRHP